MMRSNAFFQLRNFAGRRKKGDSIELSGKKKGQRKKRAMRFLELLGSFAHIQVAHKPTTLLDRSCFAGFFHSKNQKLAIVVFKFTSDLLTKH